MGIGFPELLIILIITFLIFGGRKLPELGAGLGKAIKSFNKGLKDDEKTEQQAVSEKLENQNHQ